MAQREILMGDIVDFKKSMDPKTRQLWDLGCIIDALVIEYVGKGFELFEVGGIMAHRLGEVVKNLPDKDKATDIYLDIILKKAGQSNV